jgi:hypothetical protein
MGTASRKTWLEKQADEVQIAVLTMDEEGRKLEEMVAVLQERFQLKVPVTTLHHSLQRYANTIGREKRLAAFYGRELGELFQKHPNLSPRLLAKGFLALHLKELRTAKLDPETLIYGAQGDGRLDLRDRELAAKEEANRLKAVEVELKRRQVELLERKLPKVQEEVEKAINEKASPAEVRRRIREIFGIADPGAAEKHGSGTAVPGTVDRR